jgi:hypothetical protein
MNTQRRADGTAKDAVLNLHAGSEYLRPFLGDRLIHSKYTIIVSNGISPQAREHGSLMLGEARHGV